MYKNFENIFKYPSPADKSATDKPSKKGLLYFSICLTRGRYNKRGAANTTSIGKPSACIRCRCVGRPLGQTIKFVLLALFAWCSTLYTGAKRTAHYCFYCLLRGIKVLPLVATGGEVTRLLRRARNDIRCLGRSMIEMLGVLAIIGVLSVGGIAGYSKAMEKYKINKAIENHRNIIMSLLQQAHNISKVNTNVNLNNILYALELVPENWEVHFAGQHDAYLNDELGNGVVSSYYIDRDSMLYSIALNSDNETNINDINYQFCINYITNIIQPLSDVVIQFSLYRYTVSNDVYYGKNNCSQNRNCLSQISLADITSKCKICNTKIGNNTCKLNLFLSF